MTSDEQVRLWRDGKSVHGPGCIPGDGGLCCPDFSCCRPEFQASREDREKFAKAHFAGDDKTTDGMLMGFLNRAIRIECGDKKVHVTGGHGQGS